jgi:hypothetical protein
MYEVLDSRTMSSMLTSPMPAQGAFGMLSHGTRVQPGTLHIYVYEEGTRGRWDRQKVDWEGNRWMAKVKTEWGR